MKQPPYVIYSKIHAKLLKKKGQNALAKKEATYWIYHLLLWRVLVIPDTDINVVSK